MTGGIILYKNREFHRTIDKGQIPGLKDNDYVPVILKLCDDLKRVFRLSSYDRGNLINLFGNCYRAGYLSGLKYKEKKIKEKADQLVTALETITEEPWSLGPEVPGPAEIAMQAIKEYRGEK